jgi:processive 1,2-diacylglycerol beta-glucosyltransferase
MLKKECGSMHRNHGGRHVVIFSCSYGGGHQRVAQVLVDELQRQAPECRIEIVDYIETFVGHVYNLIFSFMYFRSVRWAPWLYRWFYQATSTIPNHSRLQRFINHLGKERLARFLQQRQPEIVVCTYCLPAGAISDLKGEGRIDLPCATIVTDHAIHSQWVHPYVDLYLVSSDYVRDGIVARGFSSDQVLATGIPVAPDFVALPDRGMLHQQYALDPVVPTILVMVGAYNLLRGALRVCHCLANLPRPVQVLVVCGRDEELQRTIEQLAQSARHPVRVFGYVHEIASLMAMSNLMVSKAGGVTTSEALAAELPMMVIHPIPGQEDENASFIQRRGRESYTAPSSPLASSSCPDTRRDRPLRPGGGNLDRPAATLLPAPLGEVQSGSLSSCRPHRGVAGALVLAS